ncbi:hypothetical protein AAZX31_09G239800 [Glycine max]
MEIPKGESPNKELVEKAVEVKKEVEEVLKSANLKIVGVMERSVIMNEIDRVVNEEDLKGKIKELESEIAQGSNSEDMGKDGGVKREYSCCIVVSTLKEKIERLREDLESSSKDVYVKQLSVQS